ncbi:hypothetical protein HKX48_007174 [Thoreauomyces humboldtii]|nr:hypothetical protein HKX48_007174 [Thoreauomyces humboldtii]
MQGGGSKERVPPRKTPEKEEVGPESQAGSSRSPPKRPGSAVDDIDDRPDSVTAEAPRAQDTTLLEICKLCSQIIHDSSNLGSDRTTILSRILISSGDTELHKRLGPFGWNGTTFTSPIPDMQPILDALEMYRRYIDTAPSSIDSTGSGAGGADDTVYDRTNSVTDEAGALQEDEGMLPSMPGNMNVKTHGWTTDLRRLLTTDTVATRNTFLSKTRTDFDDVFNSLNEARRDIATPEYQRRYVALMNETSIVSEQKRDALRIAEETAREAARLATQAVHAYATAARDAASAAHVTEQSVIQGQSEAVSAARKATEEAEAVANAVSLVGTPSETASPAGLVATAACQAASEMASAARHAGVVVQHAETIAGYAGSNATDLATAVDHAAISAAIVTALPLQAAARALSVAKRDAKRAAQSASVLAVAYWKRAITEQKAANPPNGAMANALKSAKKAAEQAVTALTAIRNINDAEQNAWRQMKTTKKDADVAAKAATEAKEAADAVGAVMVPVDDNNKIAAKSLTNLHGTPYDRYIVDKMFEDSPPNTKCPLGTTVMTSMRDSLLFAECLSHDGKADDASSCWFLRKCPQALYRKMYDIQAMHNTYQTPFFYVEYRGSDGNLCDHSWTKDQGQSGSKHEHAGGPQSKDCQRHECDFKPNPNPNGELLISPTYTAVEGEPFHSWLAYEYWPYSTSSKWIMDSAPFRRDPSQQLPHSLEVAHHPIFCERNKHIKVGTYHHCFRPSHIHKMTKYANGFSKSIQNIGYVIASDTAPPRTVPRAPSDAGHTRNREIGYARNTPEPLSAVKNQTTKETKQAQARAKVRTISLKVFRKMNSDTDRNLQDSPTNFSTPSTRAPF